MIAQAETKYDVTTVARQDPGGRRAIARGIVEWESTRSGFFNAPYGLDNPVTEASPWPSGIRRLGREKVNGLDGWLWSDNGAGGDGGDQGGRCDQKHEQ